MSSRNPFRVEDEDSRLLAEIAIPAAALKPVFIMGLHRSGTTFLYESLARVFPMAPLTAYHIVFYQRLVSRHRQGTGQDDKDLLDRYFLEAGVSTRQIDEIKLSQATVEEYCWLLKRYAGSVHLNGKTAGMFAEACRKLLYLHPECETVIMKNPWDTSRGPAILELLPESRFVYLSRNPVRILDSLLRNALLFASGPSPYLDLLARGFPLARFFFDSQRILYRLAGEKLFCRIVVRRLMRDIVRELSGYRQALRELPAASVMETSYRELVTEPARVLHDIGDFLDLEARVGIDSIEAGPRAASLHPEVARVCDDFLRKLADMNLMRDENRDMI